MATRRTAAFYSPLRSLVISGLLLPVCNPVAAAADQWRQTVVDRVEQMQRIADENARAIGEWAEVGYQEYRSSKLLQQQLTQSGFTVDAGVAAMPTAFVATFGTGKPVIAFLAEFDALPGLSQTGKPQRERLADHSAGHACGHNLLGTGAVLGAVAAADWLKSARRAGTVRVYGTPAEEGGGGKVYLVRAGLFDDVDAVMNWHPDSFNASMTLPNLAMIQSRFQFYGVASHASVAPELGRSALDGIEAMDMMVNMMREHVPPTARIHYAITATNPAANVVPEYAQVNYIMRHPRAEETIGILKRVNAAAEGAALGTGTRVEPEVLTGHYGYLPNTRLAAMSYEHLKYVGGVHYSEEDLRFATELAKSLPAWRGKGASAAQIAEQAAAVRDFEPEPQSTWPASSDVGDISWVVPTNWVRAAAWVPGTTAHTWQAAAASNATVGLKGMHVAAKVLALTAVELLRSPRLLVPLREELDERRGAGFRYHALIGDRAPPLAYLQTKQLEKADGAEPAQSSTP